MPSALIVADDLTGSCDTGHSFATRGIPTSVLPTTAGTPEDTTVFVVNTDSRYDREPVATEKVESIIESHSSEIVYKKVDSTLRGNVVVEVDAAIRAVDHLTDADKPVAAIVAPAAPSVGRTTEEGIHRVDGIPVAETEFGRNSRKGVSESHLPTLFETSQNIVDHIDRCTIERGPDAVASQLDALGERNRIVVCDANTCDHLNAIAMGATGAHTNCVFVGSAGLAEHIPVSTDSTAVSASSSVSFETDGGIFAIVGSTAPQTLAALDSIPDETIIPLDPETVLDQANQLIYEISDRIVERLKRGENVVITAATDKSAVDRAHSVGSKLGLTTRTVEERVSAALASIADVTTKEHRPSGLILTGGDTAVAVLEAIEAESITLTGDEIAAGIPIGKINGGRMDGVTLITKAGGFGGKETLVDCFDRVSERE